MTSPLSREELAQYRAVALSGEPISPDIIRRYIETTRKSWLAKPSEKTQGKARTAKEKPDESQIDFF